MGAVPYSRMPAFNDGRTRESVAERHLRHQGLENGDHDPWHHSSLTLGWTDLASCDGRDFEMKAILALEDGSLFHGTGFGAHASA